MVTITSPNAFRSKPPFPGWKPIGEIDPDRCHPLIAAIYHQLPEGVRDRVSVRLLTDSYFLGTTATFTAQDGREFETRLKPVLLTSSSIEPKWAAAHVPEFFLAELCLML